MRRVDRKIRVGFTMIEILMTLSILVIFFGFSGEVFKSTVLLSSASQNLFHFQEINDSLTLLTQMDQI